jgi:riboflavin transporter FmnP
MNAKSISLIAIFAAIAIALNAIRIPTIYWPGLFYTVWEIPIVVAFLLFGFKIGVLVEILHIAGQEIFFPAGITGAVIYPMGGVAVLLMIAGVYLASRLITRKIASGKTLDEKKSATYLTAFAIVTRGGIMPFFDYGVIYHVLLPIALGRSIPETYIAGLVPSFIIYNITVALYTVPIAYIVARRVSKYLEIEPRRIRQV